ncbi:hypothetical protein Vretimale_7343 [Volvox reticuliferus]|uniref:Uncharacterized protein n=1 Tax=Volvox reticuliferus TaxID=1737510 RepID=A0A8J4FKL0_9CHLO|nr:hypothetical protein Vretifemale_7462 [Volvox reticuliferus]GIM02526.1 hypothetical protein Vretimale_7343 [Volvox reticuliferus]
MSSRIDSKQVFILFLLCGQLTAASNNLASFKETFSSSGMRAGSAVDDDIGTTAFVPVTGNLDRWISINLGGVFDISRILIWPHQYCCWYDNKDMEVRVGLRSIRSVADKSAIRDNQLVWKQNGSMRGNPDAPWEAFVIDMQPPVRGSWVTVQDFSPQNAPVFTIAEIEVYGAPSTSPVPPSPPPSPLQPPSPPRRPTLPPPAPSSPRAPTDGNLAFNKPVYISGKIDTEPSIVVDGTLASDISIGGFPDPAKWISVDLGGVWDISRILLWPSQSCCWENNDSLEVRIGLRSITSAVADTPAIQDNQLVWKQNGNVPSNPDAPWEPFVINLQLPVKGRWVTVQSVSKYTYGYFNVAEIEVYSNLTAASTQLVTSSPSFSREPTRRPTVLPPVVLQPPPIPHPSHPWPPRPQQQDGNVALFRPMFSSLPLANNSYMLQKGDMSAEYVAGGPTDEAGWISVDLGWDWNISRILVWPSQHCCWHDNVDIEVRVGMRSITSEADTSAIRDNALVWKQNGSMPSNPDAPWSAFVIILQPPVRGSWITVQNGAGASNGSYLHIANIEVYESPNSTGTASQSSLPSTPKQAANFAAPRPLVLRPLFPPLSVPIMARRQQPTGNWAQQNAPSSSCRSCPMSLFGFWCIALLLHCCSLLIWNE